MVGGYDYNFCLTREYATNTYSVKTGIKMDVFTDMLRLQFYTGR